MPYATKYSITESSAIIQLLFFTFVKIYKKIDAYGQLKKPPDNPAAFLCFLVQN